MIFPYLSVSRAGSLRSLPVVLVRIHGPAGFADVYGLVDSGAEHTVLSLRLFRMLGLSTAGATDVQVIGVGGHATRGHLLDVEYQLQRHRWTAPAIFSAAVDSQMIFGQEGFFEFFNVTFKRHQSIMDIRRAR
jgi:aspartyl protease